MSSNRGGPSAVLPTAGIIGQRNHLNPKATDFVPVIEDPKPNTTTVPPNPPRQPPGIEREDPFEWIDKQLTREAAASVAFICSALDRLSEVAKKHGHKLRSIESGSMKVVLG